MSMNASNSTNTNQNSSYNLKDIDLKILDYIPGVSTGSGVARICFGALQTLAAAVQSTVSLVDLCLHPIAGTKISDGTYVDNQGRSNMARGTVAAIPILGNITLYIYDHSRFANLGDKMDWTYVVQL